MEKIDKNKLLAQINEEASIIFENIQQAIPEKTRAISVLIAVAQVLKKTARQIKGSISELEMKIFILNVLDVIKEDEDISEHDQRGPESAQSQI